MVTAIILINVERDLILEVIDKILKVDGIMEVHSVAGEYDLAAIARVDDNQQLSMILADKMCHQIKGITLTKTLISLGSYYNFDVKNAFTAKPAKAAKAPAKKAPVKAKAVKAAKKAPVKAKAVKAAKKAPAKAKAVKAVKKAPAKAKAAKAAKKK